MTPRRVIAWSARQNGARMTGTDWLWQYHTKRGTDWLWQYHTKRDNDILAIVQERRIDRIVLPCTDLAAIGMQHGDDVGARLGEVDRNREIRLHAGFEQHGTHDVQRAGRVRMDDHLCRRIGGDEPCDGHKAAPGIQVADRDRVR
jgi:hypothetical protein